MPMFNLKLPIGPPCESGPASYWSRVALNLDGGDPQVRSIYLGDKAPLVDDTAAVIQLVHKRLQPPLHRRIIGFSLFRECRNIGRGAHQLPTIEPQLAYAFVKADGQKFAIKPGTLETNGDDIGEAGHVYVGSGKIRPIVDLLALPEERAANPAQSVREAYYSRPGSRAYIAMRGLAVVISGN